ncbi:hypothetical protein GF371_02095 [Candidatus Woesearchaeota archaeon]|nr:hypothetical protein [Candidatus Woesearchaeota archaeon]
MIDDKLFGTLVALVGGGIFLHTALSKYGYDKALHELKVSFIFLFSIAVLIMGVIFIAKKIPKKEPEIIVQRKPKKRLPKITPIPEPEEETVKSLEQMEPEDSYERPVATARPVVRVSTDVKCYKFRKLKKEEVSYLKRYGYRIRSYFNPLKGKKEKFVFKNRNEGDAHFLTIYMIAEYLGKNVDNLRTFETVKPDLTFEIAGKKIALEVETGKVLRHNKKNLINKVNLLNSNYDSWSFVVLDRNKVAKYRKYGKVIDKRYLKNQLDKFLKTAKIVHSKKQR